jgi:hypothetical protein
MGFTFDNTSNEATPTSDMRLLVESSPHNAERIFRFLGGEELNTSPTQSNSRYVINFEHLTEEQSRRWPDLVAIIEAKVKGKRGAHSTAPWWQFERPRSELYEKIRTRSRCLANSQVSAHLCFAWQPTDRVFAHTLNVFTDDRDAFFAVMQSRVHELWARFFASTLEDRLRYTPSDCFETFPFPAGWESDAALEEIGRAYHALRAEIMVAHDEGLTKTYNRFHDPDETGAEILRLRALHDRMDRAVLDAYGWQDLRPAPAFVAEHAESEGDEDEAPKARKKKRAVRYRWPDADRDAVLAKLLALNAARANEERKAREYAAQMAKVEKKTKGKKA